MSLNCQESHPKKLDLLNLLYKDKINTDLKQETSKARFYSRWHAFMHLTLSKEDLDDFEKNSFYYL